MKKRNLVLLLSMTVASLSAYSQACFNSANDYVFEGTSSSRCITKGDYDNDGDLDIVLGNYTGFNDPVLDRLYLVENNGDATFNTPVSISSGSRPIDVISSDFDNDGDMDLAVINFENSFSELAILIGNGDGTFQAPVRYDTEFGPNNLTIGDFNGDGHEDIAVTTNGSKVDVFLADNTTPGTFLPYTSLSAGTNPQDVATGDFNGDTFIDIVTANKGTGNVSVFNGDGSGGFAVHVTYATDIDCNGITVADLDGDTNLDIITANETANNISVLINDGAGSFVAAVNYAADNGTIRLEQDDVNNDGDIDIVAVNSTSNSISTFLGNGDGTLQAQNSAAAIGSPTNLVIGDFDGDSNVDVVLSCLVGQVMPVFIGDGTGNFKIGDFASAGAGPDALFAADINGDGDNDFVVVNETDGNATVHYGAGDGTFTLGQTLTTGAGPSDVSGADLDGNGFIDIIVTNYTDGNISVFMNTAGTLGAGTTTNCNATPIALDTGDVDNDGDYDIVVLNENDQVSVMIGDGTGGFGVPTTYATGSTPLGLDLGDANNDNVPDLAVANSGSNTVSYYLNNGTGVFLAPSNLGFGFNTPRAVRFADVTGDGFAEIVTANFGSNEITVNLNNGSGTLSPVATGYSSGDTGPMDLTVNDFDNDGDIDVVGIFQVSVASTGYAVLFDNDGTGTLSFSQRFSTGINPQSIVYSDFNGDGNLDLAVSNFDNNNVSILLNAVPTITALGPTTFCSGSVDLQSSPADVYNWSTAETTQTISVNASGSYSVTTSSQSGHCTGTSNSITVTVSGGPSISASGTTTICEGQSTSITISGADTYSWDSGLGTGPTKTLSPTTTTTYNVTGEITATGCQTILPVTITVNPLPDASFTTLNATYCLNDAAVTLVPATTGGTFSGDGVSGTSFDPASAGVGGATVTYNVTDGNGCSDNSSQNTTVNALPDASFTTLNASYCTDAASITLVPSTTGGTFSGSGVSGTTFDPSAATPGSVTVSYNVTSGGCSNNSSQNTTVNTLPDASFATLNASYCADEAAVNLAPATSGGTFTGSGVSGTTFDPSVATPGPITVTYNVTDGNGCSNNSSQNTTVNTVPDAAFNTIDASYCVDAATVTLTPNTTGGTFSGSGVSGTTFDPSTATPGPVTITYNITAGNGCSNSSSQNTTVNTLPDASFTTLDPDYCIDAASVTLVPTIGGGAFSGDGVSGTTFDPASAGAGLATVTYNVTDGNGCSNNSSQNTTVNALPDPSFTTLNAAYCSDAAVVNLNPTTSGGTFTGSGVSGTDFDPSTATPGTVNISYNITDGNGCSNSSNQSTVVNQIPVATFTGLDPNYCENDDVVTLIPATTGGTFTGPGGSISGFDFDPSNTGTTGTITITYDVTDGNGCSNSASANTDILATPDASFGTLDPEYCADDAVVTLVPILSGGTFSGPGMSGSDFDPSAANAGVNTIVYHVTGGNGCSDSTFQDVTVNALPDATFTTLAPTYCKNDSEIILTPNQSGGAFVGTGISNGNEFYPSIPSVGSTTVQYIITDANNCSNSTMQSTDILPLPDLNVSYNLLVLESAESTTFATYQWVDCDNNYAPISGATSQTFTVSQNGSYACIVSNGSCEDTTSCIQVMDVGVTDYKDVKGIKIYPNPTQGRFNIVLDDKANVAIYSSVGKLIFEKQFNKGMNVVQSLGEVAAGMYMIQVKYNDGTIVTEKIIVEN